MKGPWSTWGLRGTVTASFALGALIVSTLLAVGTYLTARHYLMDQRQATALRQAYADATFVVDGLLARDARIPDVLSSVNPTADSELVVRKDDRWYASALARGAQSIPAEVRDGVVNGSVMYAWAAADDQPALVVGIPLPAAGAEFYEVVSTSELRSTLTTLATVLAAFAVLATLAGAGIGRLASRRLMAPLDDVATAAARIGAGGLQTRLPPTDDPDLATIVGSFNSMVEALEDRIQRDARFAADLGHELRSPLTALVASVEVIERRRDELSSRTQRALNLVRAELDRFQQTLEDLLELGRLDAGVRSQVFSHVDAGELVRVSLEQSRHDPSLLRLVTPDDGSAADFTVRVDKQQLGRALVNLFDNADRHAGGVRAVTVQRIRDRVRIDVDDRGDGVPEPDRERIFERFVRAGSRGSLPGSGLGLSIVAETASSLGGRVWCEAAPGGGARFSVELPVAPRQAPLEVPVPDHAGVR
jgi:two-component system, OmpR family, sensor histidine kinase MtrB